MHSRRFIIGALFSLGIGAAGRAQALGADAAVWIEPQARAKLLRYFTPAAGPLERYASRPGAWYALLYVPMASRWPVQLMLSLPEKHHEIRLFALDAAPEDAPSVVHPLPLGLEATRGNRAGAQVSRFMLPAASTATAIFVLVEQWRIEGDAPAPLWVQVQSQRAPEHRGAPWWVAHEAHAASAVPPPSPLTQDLRGTRAHEVPIFNGPALAGVPGV